MMGFGHASSGACVGLAVGDVLQLHAVVILLLGLAGAGAALLCDIDCKGATASTVFGPLSGLAHNGMVELHYMVVAVVDPDNEDKHGAHRGLSHWWPWWVFNGTAVAIGCLLTHWTTVVVLIILFCLAIRGLTIPEPVTGKSTQRRFKNLARPYLHDSAMRSAYWLMNYTPLYFFRWARKHVNRKDKVDAVLFEFSVPVGKIAVFVTVATLVYAADYYHELPALGPWLGFLVYAGQLLHWIGDSPTEMGVPGFFLTRLWRLPKWIAFKAGGPFEVALLWIPMGFLMVYLLPGLRPHAEVMTVLQYLGSGLAAVVLVVAILTMLTNIVKAKRYA